MSTSLRSTAFLQLLVIALAAFLSSASAWYGFGQTRAHLPSSLHARQTRHLLSTDSSSVSFAATAPGCPAECVIGPAGPLDICDFYFEGSIADIPTFRYTRGAWYWPIPQIAVMCF